MKKKVRKLRHSSKKTPVTKKKSYYVPVAKRKAKKSAKPKAAPVAKKKYKSYYKPKKKAPSAFENAKANEALVLGRLGIVRDLPKREDAPTPSTPPTSKRPVKYLNNKDLLAQVIASKKQSRMTNELAKMLQLLTSRYGKKGNFANYTYNDDMQSYAMLMLCKTWQGFNEQKYSNAFAWYTQCIKNSFIQYLNYEKRQRDIKDEVLVDSGMNPSYNYQYEYAQENHSGGNEPNENENVEHSDKINHNTDIIDDDDTEES